MTNLSSYTLINPQNGVLAFKLFVFHDNSYFDYLQRNNYYSLIWIQEGHGKATVDFTEYQFEQNVLFAFTPYQPFMFSTGNESINGVAINFHPDFFCIHKHHKEVACSGVLFNNIYQPPFTRMDEQASNTFDLVLKQVKTELQNQALAQHELLVSYLKILLITASRLKAEQNTEIQESLSRHQEPFILQSLKDAIEAHYKTKHSASDYADALHISAKALAKITKTHFNKTLTNLIAERIIIEAKRELYLTNKPVKEIAFDLGYADEFYFSRFFKTHADVSPQQYRDTVGFGRGTASRTSMN